MSNYSVSVVIKATDKATGAIRKISNALSSLGKLASVQRLNTSLRTLGTSFQNVGNEAAMFGARLAGLAAVAGYAFKTLFLDSAVQFEQYLNVLETIEKSPEKAKKAFNWISDFSAKTPYEIDQVTEAFVTLRAYGMNPMGGLLQSLGDTSAAMGKPLMQSVEAIGDAVNGENERLKEFGIRASKAGKKITYEYTNSVGKTMKKVVDASNREMIQSTLMALFNEKYAGAMEKQANTLSGMLGNIKDQWTRFSNAVMGAGLFAFVKNEVAALLSKINMMAENGQLEFMAKGLASNFKAIFAELKQVFIDVWPVIVETGHVIADLTKQVGGYGNLLKIIVGIMAIPLVISLVNAAVAIGGFISSIWGLITSFAAFWGSIQNFLWFFNVIGVLIVDAIGWLPIIITAIIAAGVLIIANWNTVLAWFKNFWAEWGGLIRMVLPVVGLLVDAGDWLTQNWDQVAKKLQAVGTIIMQIMAVIGEFIKDMFTGAIELVNIFLNLLFGVANALKGISKAMPNTNIFTGQKNQFGTSTQATGSGVKTGPPIKTSGPAVAVALPSKRDELHMGVRIDYGKAPQITAFESKGPSKVNFNAKMGMMNA